MRSFNDGPGWFPLLSAISEGLVTRDPGYGSNYYFDGRIVGVNEVRLLVRLGYVDAPFLGGPPVITEDGWTELRKWTGDIRP